MNGHTARNLDPSLARNRRKGLLVHHRFECGRGQRREDERSTQSGVIPTDEVDIVIARRQQDRTLAEFVSQSFEKLD